MNGAEELASTASGCIRTTHARGSFYTKALATASRFFRQEQRWRPLDRLGRNPYGDRPEAGAQAAGTGQHRAGGSLSAALLPRALTCFSLSLLAFPFPRGPLALPAAGEPHSRFLRGGLELGHLFEHPGLPYPG
jgi:hypothetical protein